MYYLHFLFLLFAIQIGWMAKQCHFIQVSVYSGVSICRSYDPKYDKTDFHMAPRRGLHKGQIIFFFHKIVEYGGGAKIIIFVFGGSGLDIFFPHFVLHSPCMATLSLHVHLKYPSNGSKMKLARNNLDVFRRKHHNVSINTFSMINIVLLNSGWNTDFVKHLRLHKKKKCLFKSEEKCRHAQVIWNVYPKSDERNGIHADMYISLMYTVVQVEVYRYIWNIYVLSTYFIHILSTYT